ncbi:MAG: 50S ribosomal protein L11 methyltransferase [Burkholderiales bacterium]
MFELELQTTGEWAETLSEALINELGAVSVSVEDAHANTESEQALFGEPGLPPPVQGWDHSIIKTLFLEKFLALEALALIQSQDWADAVKVGPLVSVPDQDWVRLTQSQFNPVQITPSFWVVPTWHEPPEQARHVIRLDPGLAFGTGTHPTTRMCLRWLAQQAHPEQPWPSVLDYGCGSGILAIGAALLGAQNVMAVDIDPAALISCRSNAQANAVRLIVGLPEIAQGPFNVVLANILATPLQLLAPVLCNLVQPGGSLVLAGILKRQEQVLQSVYADHLTLKVSDEEDGWILMTAQREPL